MILPSTRLLWLLAALLAAALAASVYGAQALWFAAAAVVAAVALLDAVMALRLPAPELARRVPHALALGVRTEVVLRVLNRARRPYRQFAAYADSKLASILFVRELARQAPTAGRPRPLSIPVSCSASSAAIPGTSAG